MKRALAIVALLGSQAAANPEIAKTVTASIVELGKLADDDKLNLASDAIVIGQMGSAIDLSQHDGCTSGAVANSFYGCNQASISHVPGKAIADAAGDVGWFAIPYTVVTEDDDHAGGPLKKWKSPARAGGIVVRTGKRWEIAAIMYTNAIADADLLSKNDGPPVTAAPKLSGHGALAKEVAGWFATGFAPKAATKGTVIASGTAPNELKTGAPAIALAKSWDALKIGATTVDAKLLAGGKVGWIRAAVMMPRKKAAGAVALQLTVVVVPEGAGWRWVAMQYQPTFRLGE